MGRVEGSSQAMPVESRGVGRGGTSERAKTIFRVSEPCTGGDEVLGAVGLETSTVFLSEDAMSCDLLRRVLGEPS